MLQLTSHCLAKLLPWTTTSERKRIVRGSLAAARPTLNFPTRSITLLRAVEAIVHTGMEATLARAMAITLVVMRPMVGSEAITPMDITMVITTAIVMAITMGTVDSNIPTKMERRTW